MLNSIVKIFTGKEIVLFNRHRNSKALLNHENRKVYLFLSPWLLIKVTALFGRKTRLRYRVMAVLLSVIDPAFILDINWTSRHHRVYYTWCKKHGKKFVVLQHGAYSAGIQRDIKEKYIGCQLFLVWGEHFKQQIERTNPGKDFECVVFGNPVYNEMDRSCFEYPEGPCKKILVAVSVIHDERHQALLAFVNKMGELGFNITVKEHSQQARLSGPIEGFNKTEKNLYQMLKNREFDLVITDISSTMLDVIFFRNRVLYFSPPGDDDIYTNNVYSRFLRNMYDVADRIQTMQDLETFVDIKAQEELLGTMVATEGMNNSLSGLPFTKSHIENNTVTGEENTKQIEEVTV